jgi:hypothetical protein
MYHIQNRWPFSKMEIVDPNNEHEYMIIVSETGRVSHSFGCPQYLKSILNFNISEGNYIHSGLIILSGMLC